MLADLPQPKGQRGEAMYKIMFAAVIAAGLMAAPLPILTQPATAQTAPDKKAGLIERIKDAWDRRKSNPN